MFIGLNDSLINWQNALSTSCGTGWRSPEDYAALEAKVKVLRDAANNLKLFCENNPEQIRDVPDDVWVPFCNALTETEGCGMTPETTTYYICKFEGFNDQRYFYDEDTAKRFVQDKVEKYKGVRGEVIPVAAIKSTPCTPTH